MQCISFLLQIPLQNFEADINYISANEIIAFAWIFWPRNGTLIVICLFCIQIPLPVFCINYQTLYGLLFFNLVLLYHFLKNSSFLPPKKLTKMIFRQSQQVYIVFLTKINFREERRGEASQPSPIIHYNIFLYNTRPHQIDAGTNNYHNIPSHRVLGNGMRDSPI